MQRSIEVYDKLLSLLITFVCVIMCVQAIGLEVKSLLTISGFGGLAIGLAGREILENLFSGLLILSSRSFEVGEEIMFTQVRAASDMIVVSITGCPGEDGSFGL
jgi:mechanosensitive ion channel protein 1/2/3